MAIRIKPFFTLRRFMGNQPFIEIDSVSTTIEDLLEKLFARYGPEFRATVLDAETGGVSPNIQILVNGRSYRTLPDQLKTLLQSGDEISLFPPIAGG
jgi:MoaD family protein